MLELIHNAGGKAFLAHPYEYGFDYTIQELEMITKSYLFDGIECFHPTANDDKSNELINFCKKHCLHVSGGSDFHNLKRNNHIGLTDSEKLLCEELILPWIKEICKLKSGGLLCTN